MSFLPDTNILLRLIDRGHPMHSEAMAATRALLFTDEVVQVIPQNFTEFWNVCTRPREANGMGFTPLQTDRELTKLESILSLVPDTPAIFPEWRQLVLVHSVKGVQVHDARIAAAMTVHGISHLVTFNDRDFRRYQGITVMTPADVLNTFPDPQPLK